MSATSYLKILPALGYAMTPFESEPEFSDALGEGMAFLRLKDNTVAWVIPSAEVERYLHTATVMFGDTAFTTTLPGGEPVGCREIPLNLPEGEDGIVRLTEFLKSGLIGGIIADGYGCVFNKELIRLCSPFRDDHDLARDLEELSRKNPEPADALVANYIGKMRIEAGQTLSAAECFRKAAQLNPNYAEPLSNLGTLLWNAGRRAEALHLFAEALLRNPYDVDTQDNFIRAGFEAGEMVKMKSCLNLVRERFPDCRCLDYLNAVIAYRLGDIEGCRTMVAGILKRDPADVRARELLGELAGAVP